MGLREEILDLLVKVNGVQYRSFEPSDVLLGNGINGDDANDFIEAYSGRFNVDLSEFRHYFHYIGDEPPIRRRVFPVDAKGREIPFWPITLDMLADAAAGGQWQVSYPEHEVKTRPIWLCLLGR